MSNNFMSSNDDDIFEDYIEETTVDENYNSQNFHTQEENVDSILSDIDSPFSSILKTSSVKVSFGDAFYNAAHEWLHSGYEYANSKAILETLTNLTDGKFLYYHRLVSSSELLYRKKTIIRFLNLLLSDNTVDSFIKVVSSDSAQKNVKFNEEYFNMFFRSFYNIQLHTYKCEYAVYISLCEHLGHVPDEHLEDPFSDEIKHSTISETINDLYSAHFQKDKLGDLIEKNIQQVLSKENP